MFNHPGVAASLTMLLANLKTMAPALQILLKELQMPTTQASSMFSKVAKTCSTTQLLALSSERVVRLCQQCLRLLVQLAPLASLLDDTLARHRSVRLMLPQLLRLFLAGQGVGQKLGQWKDGRLS
jgi:hypothetical protein